MLEGSARYATLPKEIEKESEALGLAPIIGQTARDFVDEYVSMHVSQQEKKAKEESIRQQLTHKALVLDNVGLRRPGNKRKAPKGAWRPVTSKEKRSLNLYEIPEGARRFELYLPLHELWLQYMDELLQPQESSHQIGVIQSKLLKADLHGCQMTVTRSKCPSYIGQSGIILMETQNTFKIIRKDNSLKVIPKAGSVFSVGYREYIFTLYGNHLRYKSADRSARKFKTKPTIDL